MKGKVELLGSLIDIVNMDMALDMANSFIRKKQKAHIITLNAEIVYMARNDMHLREIINGADLVTPDGIGIVWAARKKGYNVKERVTGIDMIYGLCNLAVAEGYSIYLLGASPGVAEQAAAELQSLYPSLKIAGTRDGYFTDIEIRQVITGIKEASPDILLVALGAPYQEYWISQYKEELGVPLCIGVGGSFDVIAGVKKRAPEIMIKLNLEWLYRLLSEPSRIKRQIALPRFVLAVLKER